MRAVRPAWSFEAAAWRGHSAQRRPAGKMRSHGVAAATSSVRRSPSPSPMNLESILFTQGFGSRRQCRATIAEGRVEIDGAICDEPNAEFSTDALTFYVDGTPW